MNNILCPKCGEQVEISQAIAHELREKILDEVNNKHKEEISKLKLEITQQAVKKTTEELEMKYKNSQIEAEEKEKRNKNLQGQLTALMKEHYNLQQKDQERDLEMQKKILKQRELLETEITKIEQEKARLDKLELQKQLEDTKKALEEAQRKAQQSSQQLQGEVLELDLEQQLKAEFTTDEILPVPKGIDGADIVQKVRNKFGNVAGSIVWEIKRTKAWNNAWPAKLREDVRTLGAETAVLVSDVLPDGIDTFTFHNNIWVTCYRYAIPLACVLRISMLQVAQAKSASANKDEKLEMLYQYLTNASFRHRFEAQVEAIGEFRSDLEQEQRTMTRLWKKKNMQIHRMMNNVASLYGELQGILGSALPVIQGLDFEQLPEGKNDENKELEQTLF